MRKHRVEETSFAEGIGLYTILQPCGEEEGFRMFIVLEEPNLVLVEAISASIDHTGLKLGYRLRRPSVYKSLAFLGSNRVASHHDHRQ